MFASRRKSERVLAARRQPVVTPMLLAFAVFVQLTWLGANSAVLAVAAATLDIVVALVAVLALSPRPRFWWRALPVYLCVALALAWAALPAIVPQLGPRLAPDLLGAATTRFLGGIALLTAAALIGYRRGAMRTGMDWLLAFGALNIAIGLVMRQLDPLHVWGVGKGFLEGRHTGTFLNANASGAVFGMIALVAAGRWRAHHTEQRSIYAVRGRGVVGPLLLLLAVAALGACVLTASRTSLALTAVAFAAFFAIDFFEARGRGATATIAVGAIGVVLGAAAIALVAGDTFFGRIGYLPEDAIDRWRIWTHYAALAGQAPWTGYGMGSFSELNLHGMHDPAAAKTFWYINDAHNAVLQLVLEGGWPFFALIALAIGGILCTVAANRRSHPDPLVRSVLLALLVVAGCSMTDVALSVPAVIAFAAALLGLLWGWSLRAAEDRAG